MTVQKPDKCLYKNENYSIIGDNSSILFNPKDHGLHYAKISTGCWRGYFCQYGIDSSLLKLISLNIGLSGDQKQLAEQGKGPKLFEKIPQKHKIYGKKYNQESKKYEDTSLFSGYFCYENLNVTIMFSGELILCNNFIQEMYEHTGINRPYKYRNVLKLTFSNGNLICCQDCSETASKQRENFSTNLICNNKEYQKIYEKFQKIREDKLKHINKIL